MYFIATRRLTTGEGVYLMKDERVPNTIAYHLCCRYEKMDFMKRVYDSIEEEEYLKSKLDKNPDFFLYEKAVDEYKEAKKNKKRGAGIKKLADKYGLTEYSLTKALKEKGLV